MKKSKIILPAIALLAISGAASVTGTVAWFTASQATSLTASNVSAISTSGDLSAKIMSGVGVATENQTIGDNAGYVNGNAIAFYDLCDASYDALNQQLWKAVMDSDDDDASTGAVTGYQEIPNKKASSYSKDGTTKDVYFAAQWTITFSTEASFGEYDIFFDARSANSNLSDTEHAIYNAFRVAMICGDEICVWAPNGNSVKYVTSATATANYTVGTNFLAGNSDFHATSALTASDCRDNVTHLASGLVAGGEKTVSCVAWFEGTDPDCITDKANNVANITTAAQLNMAFYAVSWSTGA